MNYYKANTKPTLQQKGSAKVRAIIEPISSLTMTEKRERNKTETKTRKKNTSTEFQKCFDVELRKLERRN